LPRDVYESFVDAFYGGCSEPPFEDLRVLGKWPGEEDTQIRFTPPRGTYFLAVVGSPLGSTWHFDSVLETSRGKKSQSLHIDSTVPDELTDAQEWCTTGYGITTADYLQVDAANVAWTVYLVAPNGTEALPDTVVGALSGYYGVCPALPAIVELEATVVGTSAEGGTSRSIQFTGSAPHYFLGVRFEPNQEKWYFRSVNVRGDWKAAGPSVSSKSGERIDFTAICPQTSSPHHLDVEPEGGSWTVFLITVSQ